MYDMIRIKDIAFGACDMPNITKPGICIQENNVITCYGFFRDELEAIKFMQKITNAMNLKGAARKTRWVDLEEVIGIIQMVQSECLKEYGDSLARQLEARHITKRIINVLLDYNGERDNK